MARKPKALPYYFTAEEAQAWGLDFDHSVSTDWRATAELGSCASAGGKEELCSGRVILINFDDIDIWEPQLTQALIQMVSEDVLESLVATGTKTFDDALNRLLDFPNREEIIDATIAWLQSTTVAGYHGTRITEAECDSIREKGLLPLKARCSRRRLERALSGHERWPHVADDLDETIRACGPGEHAGRRENQVHLTLSRSGLTDDFNHYLTHGSEFDQRVAYKLLGEEGKDLLGHDGKPTVIKVAVPGAKALEAAHPSFGMGDVREREGVPNLVKEFFQSWIHKKAHPGFQCRTLLVDCGLVFKSTVPASWIVSIE